MTKLKDKIKKIVRPDIRVLQAYGVADPGDLIKLDAMENPYSWPDDLKNDWLETLRAVDVNRYPDPASRNLKTCLREAMAVPDGQEILLGNGSDELIQMVLMALALPDAKVMAPVPTFVMYGLIAGFCGMEFIGVPLQMQDFGLDMEAMRSAIREHQPAVIFLAYPNNPTGNLFNREHIETLLDSTEGLVVIDEAYHAFAGATFMDELGKRDNLLVMRTVSKLGLAGLRLGVLAGPADWLIEFDKVRLPYNINSLTQASAGFALCNRRFLDEQTQNIQTERQSLMESLTAMPGIRVWPSDANFILFRPEQLSADQVFDGLRSAGILVKNLDKSNPALRGCLRVTVGTPEENAAFLSALQKLLTG
ncbi:MAG: histidinol-phosphate transaminase [Gammaproteobacteria bacterium]|nr:MAG: histidinol-phosphate transaminase [Gammaproteobacteria bacterium]